MDEYRHRTFDPWEAAAIWAAGWPLSHTERDGERVVFVFPEGGANLRRAAEAHGRGKLKVSSLSIREGYFHMREAIDRELRHATRA
jgi:hypothetical protein